MFENGRIRVSLEDTKMPPLKCKFDGGDVCPSVVKDDDMVTVNHAGAVVQELRPSLEEIAAILDELACPELFLELRARRWNGRPGYDPEVMWRATLLRYALGLRHVRDLLAVLGMSEPLRAVCGFDDRLPSESTFSRFTSRLLEYGGVVGELFAGLVRVAGELVNDAADALERMEPERKVVRFAQDVAIDSTDVEAHARGAKDGESKDPDAKWGQRTSKDPQTKRQLFFGFKLHAICDANYGFPLTYRVLPANVNDQKVFRELVEDLVEGDERFKPYSVIGDRAYDATDNYVYLDRHKVAAVFHFRGEGRSDDVYNPKGRPTCIGGMEMEYVGTHRKKGHLFRCPEGGCHLKNEVQFSRHCDVSFYDWPETGADLRLLGRLARASKRWRRLYKRRTEVERMFGNMKQSRILDQHFRLGIRRVKLHVEFSLLAYLGTMLTRARSGEWRRLRQMDLRFGLRGLARFA